MPQKLPEWDLRDLYPSPHSAQVKADIKCAQALCVAFEKRYKGKLKGMSGAALAKAIGEYERIHDVLGRLGSYAQLLYAGNMKDAKVTQFYQNIQEQTNAFSTRLLFFGLELNSLDEKNIAGKLQDKALKKYAPWIRDTRVFKPHQLPNDIEKLLHEKYVAGRAAWVRLFDETMTGLVFHVGGKKLTSAQAFDLLSSKHAKTRAQAAKVISDVLNSNIKTFALITNTLAKDKEIEDNWRKYKTPISSRNLGNYVEDEVVAALMSAVRKSYPRLSHRYYKLKTKWLGVKKLNYWDRNAPLPQDVDKKYSWDEAREVVLSSYAAFSPTLAKIGKQFFDKRWIDVPVREGKTDGAFAHPTVPSSHPYLLLNFQGKTRDVMTLAHELGHGVHQVLSARQGALMADTPLTLAETASVFGEQLAFRELLKREKNPIRKRMMIASKVEDMLNTVVRQVAFCEFETRLHAERRQGELTAQRIGELWMQCQKESLGSAFALSDDYACYWSYIPHFVHTPFYVYAYAFGDCLVNSLYAVYLRGQKNGKNPEFEKKYLTMLEAGGTLRHKELLRPFGLDASKPSFWQEGLDIISGFIDELEAV